VGFGRTLLDQLDMKAVAAQLGSICLLLDAGKKDTAERVSRFHFALQMTSHPSYTLNSSAQTTASTQQRAPFYLSSTGLAVSLYLGVFYLQMLVLLLVRSRIGS
jgi:hypothetical protein